MLSISQIIFPCPLIPKTLKSKIKLDTRSVIMAGYRNYVGVGLGSLSKVTQNGWDRWAKKNYSLLVKSKGRLESLPNLPLYLATQTYLLASLILWVKGILRYFSFYLKLHYLSSISPFFSFKPSPVWANVCRTHVRLLDVIRMSCVHWKWNNIYFNFEQTTFGVRKFKKIFFKVKVEMYSY